MQFVNTHFKCIILVLATHLICCESFLPNTLTTPKGQTKTAMKFTSMFLVLCSY